MYRPIKCSNIKGFHNSSSWNNCTMYWWSISSSACDSLPLFILPLGPPLHLPILLGISDLFFNTDSRYAFSLETFLIPRKYWQHFWVPLLPCIELLCWNVWLLRNISSHASYEYRPPDTTNSLAYEIVLFSLELFWVRFNSFVSSALVTLWKMRKTEGTKIMVL